MKKNSWLTLIIIIIALVPLAYLAIIWNSIPQTIAMHYDAHMHPDRMGSKTELWIPTSIIAVISIFVFFLLNNIRRIDPKRYGDNQSSTFNKIAAVIVVFIAALNIMIIVSTIKGTFVMQRFMFPMLGLLFAVIGNYMNNIKPNYFAGIRLPWTLSDDDNWRQTHHLASKIWFIGGLFLTVISLLLPFKVMLPVFMSVVVVMVIIPAVFSYRLFKEKQRRSTD